MFAVLTFDKDPMRLQDVPASLLSWIQIAGGWATFGVLLWLLIRYPRMRPEDRAQIVPWQKRLFLAGLVVALFGNLFALVAALIGMAPRFAEGAGKYQTIALTIGGAGAILAAGLPFVLPLSALRFRRIWAIARVSFKEAVRNRVLYGFSAMLLVFLFGSWFIPYKPEHQVRTYVGVVYSAMNILLLVTAIALAAFSIPTDIRRQTIHTITTKPVERFEIILGRFLGFAGLMTLVLLLMTALSVIYVLREVDPAAAEESLKAREPLYGTLHFINADDPQKGVNVGREWNYRGYITAAAPNKESEYAIWDFTSVPRSLANRDTVRCEFAFDIYRQTKGFENRGVSCAIQFQTANFGERDRDAYNNDRNRWIAKNNLFTDKDIDDWLTSYRSRLQSAPKPPSEGDLEARLAKKRARLTEKPLSGNPPQYSVTDPVIYDELAEEYGYYEEPGKAITDFHTLYIDVPGGLFRNAFQGVPSMAARPDAPLVQTLVSVTKQDSTQYIGMAKYDLYWRLDDPYSSQGMQKAAFTLNFFKGAFGLWLRLCMVIGVAVSLSTFLSGVISMIVAAILYAGGVVLDFIQSVGQGTAPGGGPMEALVRLANRQIALIPLDEGTAATLATSTDVVTRFFIRLVTTLIPDVNRYDLTAYVSEGFSIPFTQILLDFGTMALYLLPWIVAAYYLLKWREIAAPT